MATDHRRGIQQLHLWEQIADQLRLEIHEGEWEPGTRLLTGELAARWGVSRGPVREALMALSNEGIVITTRRHGTVVGTPSTVDLQEIFSMREAIETFAGVAVLTRGPLTLTDAAALSSALRAADEADVKGDTEAVMRADLAFHQQMVDLAGNSRFSTVNQNMISQNVQHAKSVDTAGPSGSGWQSTRAIHQAILDAVVQRDIPAYRAAVKQHYENATARFYSSVPDVAGVFSLRAGLDPPAVGTPLPAGWSTSADPQGHRP